MNKLAHTIKGTAEILSSSPTKVYDFIAEGLLKPRRLGGRTVILDSDLRSFLAALPVADDAAPKAVAVAKARAAKRAAAA
jgi:hypothetical protein